jgi:hypothetical protein
MTAPYWGLNDTLTDVFKLRKFCKASLVHLSALITLFLIKTANAHLYFSDNFISNVLLKNTDVASHSTRCSVNLILRVVHNLFIWL